MPTPEYAQSTVVARAIAEFIGKKEYKDVAVSLQPVAEGSTDVIGVGLCMLKEDIPSQQKLLCMNALTSVMRQTVEQQEEWESDVR